MENGRKYKSNPYLIGLLVIGTIIVIIEVISYVIHRNRIWYFDLYGINFYYFEFLFFIIALLSAQVTYLDAKKIEAGKSAPHQKTFRAMTLFVGYPKTLTVRPLFSPRGHSSIMAS